MVVSYLTEHTQANHAHFAGFIQSGNLALQQLTDQGVLSTDTTAGLAQINQEVSRQALNMAYLQDFRLMMWLTVVAVPLLFLIKAPKRQATAQTQAQTAVME